VDRSGIQDSLAAFASDLRRGNLGEMLEAKIRSVLIDQLACIIGGTPLVVDVKRLCTPHHRVAHSRSALWDRPKRPGSLPSRDMFRRRTTWRRRHRCTQEQSLGRPHDRTANRIVARETMKQSTWVTKR
jgi:hypothetical protein